MGAQAGGVANPQNASDLAFAVISEAVREIGVRYKGIEGNRLVFERVKNDAPALEDVQVIANRIMHIVSRLATESDVVRGFLEQARPERLQIS